MLGGWEGQQKNVYLEGRKEGPRYKCILGGRRVGGLTNKCLPGGKRLGGLACKCIPDCWRLGGLA